MGARWKVLPTIAVVGVLVAGCAGDEPIETAQPGTTAVTAPTSSADPDAGLWDPCTLPDATLTAAGLNPATEEKDVAGVKFEDWKVCSWTDSKKTYTFGVFTTSHTLDEVRQRPDYGDFVDAELGGKKALQYRSTGSRRDFSCSVAVQQPGGGMVDFDVLVRHSARDLAAEPCAEVLRLAELLIVDVPSS